MSRGILDILKWKIKTKQKHIQIRQYKLVRIAKGFAEARLSQILINFEKN